MAETKPSRVQPDLTGKVLGEFELTRRLGGGGMGEVYLAHQKSLKRQVAVKILRQELVADKTALLRFEAEAIAVAKLNHANIVQVHTIGEDSGLHFMVLEYVEGRNLREHLSRKGTFDLAMALRIMQQIAAALTRASEMGFVHRDIKPENILLTRKVEVKVADFGLSRCFSSEEKLNITRSGITMGTPLYMSPEQVQGKVVDPRSDIYSFGITCYHMLKGEPPFRGATAFEVALQHVQNDPPPLAEARPDLPPDICALVHKMIAKKPEDRYQSAKEIVREIQRIREGIPLAQPIAMASGVTQPVIQQANTAPLTQALTVELVEPSKGRRLTRWLIPLGGLVAATGVGIGLHKIYPYSFTAASTPPVAATEDSQQLKVEHALSPNKKRILELKELIDKKDLKFEYALGDLLELSTALIKEKQFDEAVKLFDKANLKERGMFKEIKDSPPAQAANPLKSPVIMGMTKDKFITLISHLGKGIVLAYKDEAKASSDEFKLAVELPRSNSKSETVPPKKESNIFSPIETFLRNTAAQAWKKAFADALERDRINLGPKGTLDPLLEPFSSYRPKASKIDTPLPMPKAAN